MSHLDDIKEKFLSESLITIENGKYYSVPEILHAHTKQINYLLNKEESSYQVPITALGCVGDGETDNADCLQQAVDIAKEYNIPELIVPAGLYRLSHCVNLKGIKLIGQGCSLPFLGWDYTRPNGIDAFETYVNQCKGSVFIIDGECGFNGEVHLEKLGLFGNRRKQHAGIKTDILMTLRGVHLSGFGSYAIDMSDGCIQPCLVDCKIEQNQIGIFIDEKTSNGYTGETNRFYAYNCSFCRNENYGIYGTFKGRSIHIEECSFECIGEPSDPERFKPTSDGDIRPAIELYLKSTNLGMTNGDIKILNCYSEETYGFIKLHSMDTISDITINNNFWRPYDQTHYSCFISLNGYIEDVYVQGNNVYTQHEIIYFSHYNVRHFITDIGQLASYYPTMLAIPYKGILASQYVNIASTAPYEEYQFESGFITGSSYDTNSYRDNPFIGEKGITYFFIDETKKGTFDLGNAGTDFNGSHCGKLLVVNDQPVGIIVANSNSLFGVRGDMSGIDIGDGHARIQRLGGFTTMRADGQQIKIVYDMDGTALPFGK